MQDQVFHTRDGPEYAGSRLAKQLEQGRLSNKEVSLIKDFLYERKAKKNLSGVFYWIDNCMKETISINLK